MIRQTSSPIKLSKSLRNAAIVESKPSWLSESIKKMDIFDQDIEILFENGKPKLQTHCGVVLALTMIFILIAYGYMKAVIMVDYQDNKIQEPTRSNYFGPDFIYDERDGWKVAFGITAYDNQSDKTPFDDSYGTLGAFEKIWGEEDEDGNIKDTYFKKLETGPCQASDINLDGGENDG